MRTAQLLTVCAIALVVVGAGLSFFGYNESLQPVTVTSTGSFTTTSTRVIGSTSTETIVETQSSTLTILSETYDLDGTGGVGGPAKYCGVYVYYSPTLPTGPVHVSYSSQGGPHSEGGKIDFWLLTESQWLNWRGRSCTTVRQAPAMVTHFNAN
mgnify:CR=1 FL=1